MIQDLSATMFDAVTDAVYVHIKARDELAALWSERPISEWAEIRQALCAKPSLFGLSARDAEFVILVVEAKYDGAAK